MIISLIAYFLLGVLIGLAVSFVMIKVFRVHSMWKIQLVNVTILTIIYFLFLN